MVEIYGVIAILALAGLSYYLGMRTANWYHDKAEHDRKEALERQYARIRSGSDYYDPVGPYISSWNRPQKPAFTPAQLKEFEARMNDNGSAVCMLNRNPNTTPHDKKRRSES